MRLPARGVYSIKGNTALLQVLAMAGDVNPDIASDEVVVFRTVDDQRKASKGCDEYRATNRLSILLIVGPVLRYRPTWDGSHLRGW